MSENMVFRPVPRSHSVPVPVPSVFDYVVTITVVVDEKHSKFSPRRVTYSGPNMSHRCSNQYKRSLPYLKDLF